MCAHLSHRGHFGMGASFSYAAAASGEHLRSADWPHRRSRQPALLLVLLAAVAALGVCMCSRDPDSPPNPLPCDCSDVDPRDDFTKVCQGGCKSIRGAEEALGGFP